MQERGISIRPVLQVVARVSAESAYLPSSEGTSSQECGYHRTSAAAMPFEHRHFMQDNELPLTRILGNPAGMKRHRVSYDTIIIIKCYVRH